MPMRAASSMWFYARLAQVCAAFAAGVFLPLPQDSDYSHAAPWYFSLVLAAFGAGGTLFTLLIQPKTGEKWERPSWHSSGYNHRQPLVLLHFGAWIIAAAGAGYALHSLLGTSANWFWEIPVSFAVGGLAGVRAATAIFKDRVAEA